MKKSLIILSILTAILLSATAVSAAVLSPGLDVISNEMEVTVSALKGETVTFKKDQFSKAVGASDYEALKITELPAAEDGTLYFGDVAVTIGQIIPSDKVSLLRFEPGEGVEKTGFGFVFDDSYAMTCSVVYSSKKNTSPTVFSSPALTVFSSGRLCGEMRAHDADGDELYFEVVDYPKAGQLKYDSSSGSFTYTAGSRIGEDSFTYRVKDSHGSLSEKCELVITVTDNEGGAVFKDMDDSGSVAAAVIMSDKGYMSCVEDSGELYFSPESPVTRLDFLVTAMNVFGADKLPEVESCGFADDSAVPEKYKSYVYSASKLGIISDSNGGKAYFRPQDSVTGAEASVILNNIIGKKATAVSDMEGVPEWADGAVSAMYELGVYDAKDPRWEAASAMTKETVADMLYRVYSLLGE